MKRTCRRILTLLSYALRIEPVLIREVRRLLVKGGLGAGLEAQVWQDPALRGQLYEAAEFDPEEARQLQANFDHETLVSARKSSRSFDALICTTMNSSGSSNVSVLRPKPPKLGLRRQ